MVNTQAAEAFTNARQVEAGPAGETEPINLGHDLLHYLREYARENPETAALWCFGIGFVLGWKLKLW